MIRPVLTGLTGLTAAWTLLIAGPAMAQQVVPAQSEIGFVSKQMGVPVEGRFKQWTAKIAFDPKKAEAASVAFTIQTGSASFGAAEIDGEVPKAEWFNAAKFPQASFASSAIKPLGGGRFELRGKLAIKGATQDVVVPVTLIQTTGAAGTAGAASAAVGNFVIKRLDFKIGDGDWADTSMVASDVTVKFQRALTGMAPL